jgi:2-oxoglutarate ferredoxin oxidoreductase subunit delta
MKPDLGRIEIHSEECKGCCLCIESCNLKVLEPAALPNRCGYHPAVYSGHGCTGCGLCFCVCPEPGAIVVHKLCQNN